ncbi:MAG: hypothetical protein MJ067_05055, partial [Oscillospiraceae bacterium]|nr:hypothetical protein [Oscillospiraceae bacterium]
SAYSKVVKAKEEVRIAEEERIAAEKAAAEEAERLRLETEEAARKAAEEAAKVAEEEKLSSLAANKQAKLLNEQAISEAKRGNPFDIKISKTIKLAVAALLIAALLIFILLRKKVNVLFAILGVAVIIAAVAVTYFGHEKGTVVSRADGDPSAVTKEFFQGIVSGDYQKSYALLSDYSELGLNAEFEDKYEKAIFEALKSSYSYELPYEPVTDTFTASQVVVFTSLNIPSIQEDLKQSVNIALEYATENTDKREYLGEDGDYTDEFIDSIWDAAFTEVMKNIDAYNTSRVFTIGIDYNAGVWSIRTDETLLKALSGGTYGA